MFRIEKHREIFWVETQPKESLKRNSFFFGFFLPCQTTLYSSRGGGPYILSG